MKNLLLSLLVACVLVFFGSGAWAWQTNISGTPSAGVGFYAVAKDGVGNVVAAGFTNHTGTFGDLDFTVVKLDGASGVELWGQMNNGSANGSGDGALAVATDGAGNVVAAGFIENASTGRDFTVIKLDGASGVELWGQMINGSADGNDEARSVAVDGAGNVIAAGSMSGDFTVIKFDGVNGAELWRRAINSGSANAVTVDGAGNVIAAGSAGSISRDFMVIKFDGANGGELWRQVTNGTAGSGGWANAVAVDGFGNVVAAGSTFNTDTRADFTVVKFEGANGAEVWRRVIDGGGNLIDEARAVAVDSGGNVVAAGRTVNIIVGQFIREGSSSDFMVVKFDGATGLELWRQVIRGYSIKYGANNVAGAVTVDGGGDVVAAGVTINDYRDFTVVKFNGAIGLELWRQVISGGGAGAVTVDGGGNVVAAGGISGLASVVKLRGMDGGDF